MHHPAWHLDAQKQQSQEATPHAFSVLNAFLTDALVSNFPVNSTGVGGDLPLEPLPSYQNSPSSCRSVRFALTSGSTVFQLGQLGSKAIGEVLGMSV